MFFFLLLLLYRLNMASHKRSSTRFLRELDPDSYLAFFEKYRIPQTVRMEPADEDNLELGLNHIFMPILAIIEGGSGSPCTHSSANSFTN